MNARYFVPYLKQLVFVYVDNSLQKAAKIFIDVSDGDCKN